MADWKRFMIKSLALMCVLAFTGASTFAQKVVDVKHQTAKTSGIANLKNQPEEMTDEEMAQVKGEVAPAIAAAAALTGIAVRAYVNTFLAFTAKAEAEQVFHNGGHRLHRQQHTKGWLHWHFPLPYVHYHHQR